MRPRRMQTDIRLMQSFIRSTQLQVELHTALINNICGPAACKTDIRLMQSFIRSTQLQLELHTALINSHAARKQQTDISLKA